MILPEILSAAVSVSSSSGSDGSPFWLLFAGPLGGLMTYAVIFRHYRNYDKTHEFESETLIDAQPVQGGVEKVDHVKKSAQETIEGDNRDQHRIRVQRYAWPGQPQ